MIVNVSPSKECQKETERTLEFGREVPLLNNCIFLKLTIKIILIYFANFYVTFIIFFTGQQSSAWEHSTEK